MRVGLLVYGDLDARSGGFLYDRKLADHLEAAGDEVRVFSLPERRYVGSLAHNVSRSLRRRVRGANLDALLQDELCHPSLAWFNRRLRLDAPVVAVVHHLRSVEPRPEWRNEIYRRVERRYLDGVDAFVHNSETTRRAVGRLTDPDPSVVAYPAGDRFGDVLSPDRIRERAQERPLRVIFVGNVTRRKGVHTLVEGLGRTRADWRLTVVGDLGVDSAYVAKLRDTVEELGLGDRVALTGRLPDDELAGLLADSHLFAMPSSYEGFGIAYVEAMGFGLPVIASTAGGARELVSHRENGVLVAPDDPSEIVDAVTPLSRDRERLAEMSLAARKAHLAHPTWDETGRRIRAFLVGLCSDAEPTADEADRRAQ
ncbi:glycosyltransferase family 4 protein [Halegenticoccus tardaugens]|uniref:glycosyltransferase family 4 protein n=1 Tax=Halegenticoccus tardaugens TaxID=2071624 RepID=UPI00100A77FD|nr:glycosyltransferase family 4 protein [Halegenticoccus tardaugens]